MANNTFEQDLIEALNAKDSILDFNRFQENKIYDVLLFDIMHAKPTPKSGNYSGTYRIMTAKMPDYHEEIGIPENTEYLQEFPIASFMIGLRRCHFKKITPSDLSGWVKCRIFRTRNAKGNVVNIRSIMAGGSD